MREMTVRIQFTQPCLGAAVRHQEKTGNLYFVRNPAGSILFLQTWHQQNMRFAAQLLGITAVKTDKILWDTVVDGRPAEGENRWHCVYRPVAAGVKRRYSRHEAFQPGRVIGLNCVVPEEISDDELWQLMAAAGRFRGLSPYRPAENLTEHGRYEVISVRRRRPEVTGGESIETERAS